MERKLYKSLIKNLDKEFKYFSKKKTNSLSGKVFNFPLVQKQIQIFKNIIPISSKISKKKDIELFNSFCSIPHLKKRDKGGEDAHLELENLLVVADGVGSWNSYGIDPKEYAWSLCQNIKEIYEQMEIDNDEEIDLMRIIQEASVLTKVIGSSTCCLIMLDRQNRKIKTASVGDSLYMLAKYSIKEDKFEFHFKSQEKVHRFNQPYQLGTNGDDPTSAITETHDVEDKDIIVLASDGLWDNLNEDAIIEILNKNNQNGIVEMKGKNSIAEIIARLAEEKSLDRNYESPFSIKAKQNGMFHIKGGKQDDITVIISQIMNKNETIIKNESSCVIENLKFKF